MIDVAYDGAGRVSQLPLPFYPRLEPYVESVSDILEEYDTLQYNPEKCDEMFEAAGLLKNGQGWWERDGEVLQMTLNGFDVFADIKPIVAEMLHQNDIDTARAGPPDDPFGRIPGRSDLRLSRHRNGPLQCDSAIRLFPPARDHLHHCVGRDARHIGA
jgi:peptide/nickel transport system substrate-binding protein